MSAGLFGRFLVAAVAIFTVSCGLCTRVQAQPKVCGNQPALGGWALASCPVLRDDDGDGIYAVTLSISDTALLEYKVLPTGMWDGTTEIRASGTCPADGGSKRNDTQNIQIVRPDSQKLATFYLDTRSLGDPSYSPAPGGRSAGDSLMLEAPAGSCPRWVAVGDFQNLPGPNATAVPLLPLRPGVWVGRTTAAKALATGWRWKVAEQSAGVAREYGPGGWAYAPCEANPATVATAASVGDSVYFLFHAHGGRLQTVVSATPLDGFSTDGSPSCQPPVDMAAPVDMAGPASDAATGPPLSDAGADGGLLRRPGIHCECQLGRGPAHPARSQVAMVALAGLCLAIRRRRRSSRQTAR